MVLLLLVGEGVSVSAVCIVASAPEAPSKTSIHQARQTLGPGPAQPSPAQPVGPSELACNILTLRRCLRLGDFEGPAELVIEALVHVPRQ